tara:strand:- start:6039 stop:7076 length:1038 start_codon:yes stop_codon:yes gene_type:complete
MAKENGQVEEAEIMEDSDIEKKIEEGAGATANKELGLPDVDDEEGREDSEEDGEGGTKKAPENKTKPSKASAKQEAKKEDKEDDVKEEEEEAEEEEAKKEEIEVNVDEDVAALINGEELSEEFKTKAATIFEAAVKSKIAKIRKQIREESKKEQDERITSMQDEMTENMDKYLNYAAKEWMEENKLAVEHGVRNEVTDSLVAGLKKLLEDHYIDVPEEKEDVFESLVIENKELEEKLDTQTQKHMDTVKELNTYKAASIFQTVAEGMVDTDVEKFKELVEDVDYDADEQYAEKLNTIKNSYFKSDKKDEVVDNKQTAGTNNPVVDGQGDGRMDSVLKAISSLSKK